MAGTIIADKIQTENTFLTLNVGQTLVATINSSGILNSSGGTMIGANGSVSNTAITGVITGSQLASPLSLTGNVSLTGNLSFDSTGTSGMRLPAANTLVFHTAGTEDMRIDSTGRVGIGTTSPNTRLHVTGAGSGIFGVYDDVVKVKGTSYTYLHLDGTNSQTGIILQANTNNGWLISQDGSQGLKFARMTSINESGLTNAKDTGTPSMLLTAAGQLAMGDTSAAASKLHVNGNNSGSSFGLYVRNNQNGGAAMGINAENPTSTHIQFYNNDGVPTGYINKNGASAVQYITSSDYRLKENVAPMTGALSKVAQLKPCTYTWKLDGGLGEGFIAHELQEVVPRAVSGEKDAIDAEGNIKPQGIDASYLVATLTAAIQEQQAIISDLKARIEALEA